MKFRLERPATIRAGAALLSGKRDRERTAYVVKGGRAALDYWLKFRGDEPGPLLVPVSKSGTITLRRMTTQALMLRLRRRCKQAGVDRCSPHDLEDDPPLRPPRRRGAAPGRDAAPRSVPGSARTAGTARSLASPRRIPGAGLLMGPTGLGKHPPVGPPGRGCAPEYVRLTNSGACGLLAIARRGPRCSPAAVSTNGRSLRRHPRRPSVRSGVQPEGERSGSPHTAPPLWGRLVAASGSATRTSPGRPAGVSAP